MNIKYCLKVKDLGVNSSILFTKVVENDSLMTIKNQIFDFFNEKNEKVKFDDIDIKGKNIFITNRDFVVDLKFKISPVLEVEGKFFKLKSLKI